MLKFPIKFEVEAEAKPGISTNWKGQAPNLSPITCAIPPEFMGPGGGYSPEDLFILSILSCLLALFKAYCEKNKITFHEVKSRAILTVDRNHTASVLVFTHIDIFIDVTGASDTEKARHQLDKALKDCPVSNAIKTGKTFHITVK